MKKYLELLKSEDGQGMIEYGLILALVAIAAILVLPSLGSTVKSTFTNANNALKTTPAP